jgi:hypothetical protein
VIDTNLKITYSNLVKILNFKVIHTWSKKKYLKREKRFGRILREEQNFGKQNEKFGIKSKQTKN